MPQSSENAVGPGFAQPGNAGQIKDPPQIAGVAVFLGDKELDRFSVGREALPPRELFSPLNQVFTFGTFAQLKLLDRGGNGCQFRFVELGASLPWNGQQ